jgi:protein-L-isoaspartate O-methyltransferase
MPQPNAAMLTYYATSAPEYNSACLKPERQGDLRATERRLAPLFRGATVLEVACGTGYRKQFIAPVAEHVVAVNASPEHSQRSIRRFLVFAYAQVKAARISKRPGAAACLRRSSGVAGQSLCRR